MVQNSKQQQQTIRNFISFSFFVWFSFMIPRKASRVEPRPTDTRLIRAPIYKGQFRLSQRKAHICPLKLTSLNRRTPVNSDNGYFLCPESVSCSNNDILILVTSFYYTAKQCDVLDFGQSVLFFECFAHILQSFKKVFFLLLPKFHFLGFLLQSLLLFFFISIKHLSLTFFLRAS